MDEKKFPLGSKQIYTVSPPESTYYQSQKSKPLSSCLLFVLLTVFVFTLGCFAVYTALSMGAFNKNATEMATAKPLVMERVDPEPSKKGSMHVHITITGKEKKPDDEFLSNFIKKLVGSDLLNSSERIFSEESPSLEKKKPNTVTIKTWRVSTIPKIDRSPSIFDDIFDPFSLNTSPLPKKPTTERKVFVFPPTTKSTSNPKPVDNSFPNTIFKDFEGILKNIDKIFGSSSEENNKTSSSKPNVQRNVVTSGSFIPFFNSKPSVSFTPMTKPREEVDVFKTLEEPFMNRYKTVKKTNDPSNNILKIFGEEIPTPQNKPKPFQTGPLSTFGNYEPQIIFYDYPYPSRYNTYKYPKKFHSDTKFYTTTSKPTTYNRASHIATTESPEPTMTTSSTSPKITTTVLPYTITSEQTTNKYPKFLNEKQTHF